MSVYYVGSVQYDGSSLYHHGIKGQKWYRRRFQNEDGSLTPLGRVRYGVGKAGDKVKQSIKNSYTEHRERSKQLKADRPTKNPAKMTNEELSAAIKRMDMERQYKDLRDKLYPDKLAGLKKTVGEIVSSGAKTIANKGFNKLAEKIFPDAKEKELTDIFLKDPKDLSKYSNKQIEELKKRRDNIKAITEDNKKWQEKLDKEPEEKKKKEQDKRIELFWDQVDKNFKRAVQREKKDANKTQKREEREAAQEQKYQKRLDKEAARYTKEVEQRAKQNVARGKETVDSLESLFPTTKAGIYLKNSEEKRKKGKALVLEFDDWGRIIDD